MSDQVVQVVDLLIKGGGGEPIRTVFPVVDIQVVQRNGEEAYAFFPAETPSNFNVTLPIRGSDIVAMFTYNAGDANAPEMRAPATASQDSDEAQ